MSRPRSDDLSNLSLFELFRVEVENQTAILTSGLLELERSPAAPRQLEMLMRAAHSLKGAARIVNLQTAVRVAHAMEDCFVAAQNGKIQLGRTETDVLLRGIDLLLQVSREAEGDAAAWETGHLAEVHQFLRQLEKLAPGSGGSAYPIETFPVPFDAPLTASEKPAGSGRPRKLENSERVLRLTAENLNRLLALAGESLVESRWLRPFSDSMQRLKRMQREVSQNLEALRAALDGHGMPESAQDHLAGGFQKIFECQQFLAEKLQELELFDRRSAHLSHRLYLEVLRARMRPFGDGVRRFPRMVRDLGRSLGKEVRLEITGENTQVDRDLLDRLEIPLAHLLRNAVDHGCESPADRQRLGKPAEGLIQLEARHSAGMLLVTVSDDGAGIDRDRIRHTITEKKLAENAVAARLSENELLNYLFLPGFTLKQTVTEISGRGVGLDIVQNMVKSVRGAVRVQTQPGRGTRFQLQLPLTLSVLRALLVQVNGEPYAIPLGQLNRALKLPRGEIQTLENRHYFTLENQSVVLLTAHEVLGCGDPALTGDHLPVVVLGNRNARYGLVVDRLLDERELVVQPLDSRLGKIKDVSAAALMEDGSPVLIIDVEDMLDSIERLLENGRPSPALPVRPAAPNRRKRILAVDDSLTARELERKLLAEQGYLADVAADGLEGWNAVRSTHYDLVITDVDMPHMDGIELATLIKKDPVLKSIPVMIISYKDHEQDRLRGVEAGADYYLPKGNFDDESLLRAVASLIGDPEYSHG